MRMPVSMAAALVLAVAGLTASTGVAVADDDLVNAANAHVVAHNSPAVAVATATATARAVIFNCGRLTVASEGFAGRCSGPIAPRRKGEVVHVGGRVVLNGDMPSRAGLRTPAQFTCSSASVRFTGSTAAEGLAVTGSSCVRTGQGASAASARPEPAGKWVPAFATFLPRAR
jgi:galactokinase